MRSRDEPRHSSCHPKLVLSTSGESIQPAASCLRMVREVRRPHGAACSGDIPEHWCMARS
jgi:hypothetical protein